MTTTNLLVEKARDILGEAEHIQTRKEHAMIWDRTVDIIKTANDCLETGGFIGEAYNELREAKRIALHAQTIAGKQAVRTYSRD